MITIFNYNETPISFNFGEETNMINATEMLKAYPKKRMSDFNNAKATKAYIDTLIKLTGISVGFEYQGITTPIPGIIEITQTTKTDKATWMHEDLALYFAQWLDPVFHIWCNRKIKELLTTGQTTATDAERSEWLDKFEGLKGKFKRNSRWKPLVSDILKDLSLNNARTHECKQCFNDIMKLVPSDKKLKVATEIIKLIKHDFNRNEWFDRGIKDDLIDAHTVYAQALLKLRLTNESKKKDKATSLYLAEKERNDALQSALSQDKRPIKLDLSAETLAIDVEEIKELLATTDNCKPIYCSHVQTNYNIGKGPMNEPHLIGSVPLLLKVGTETQQSEGHVQLWIYPNAGSIAVYGQVCHAKGTASRKICSIDLKLDDLNKEQMIGWDDSLQYYATFHIESKYLVIYKYGL